MAVVPGVNIGAGLLILIAVWLLALIVIAVLAIVPKARYCIPVVILIGVVITLLFLLLTYISSQYSSSTDGSDDIDRLFIVRIVFLIITGLSILVGCVLLIGFHFADTIRAGPLHKQKMT